MKIDKRTLTIVGTTMLFEFIADSAIYSIARAKKEGKFSFKLATGIDAVKIIAFGIVSGFAIDFLIQAIENTQKSTAEKELDKLAAQEKEKVIAGLYVGKTPTKIQWA